MIREGYTDSWGDDPPLCTMRCMRPSALTIDGEPYCLDCTEEWLDRLQAIELRPDLVDVLPSLTPKGEDYETVRRRMRNRMPTARNISDDSDQFRALGKAWASSPFNPANDPNASRPGRSPRHAPSTPRVTRDQPHEPKPEPAGQISLLADEA